MLTSAIRTILLIFYFGNGNGIFFVYVFIEKTGKIFFPFAVWTYRKFAVTVNFKCVFTFTALNFQWNHRVKLLLSVT